MTLIHHKEITFNPPLYKIRQLIELVKKATSKLDFDAFKKHIAVTTGTGFRTIRDVWGAKKQGDTAVNAALLELLAQAFTDVLDFHITAEDLKNRPGNYIELRVHFDQEVKKSTKWKKVTEYYNTLAKYPLQIRPFICVNLNHLLGVGHEPQSLKFLREYLNYHQGALTQDIAIAISIYERGMIEKKKERQEILAFFNRRSKLKFAPTEQEKANIKTLIDVG